MHTLLLDIGIAIIIASATTLLAYFLKQPTIIGYLLAGVIIGPYMTPQLVSDVKNIDTISEIGLILLLFIIGLELNPQSLLTHGKAILMAGVLQLPINMILTVICLNILSTIFLIQMNLFYWAVFCSLSSTAIVVKSLYDKFELDSITGRLSIGILIFQDLWAIIILIIQPNLNHLELSPLLLAFTKAIALIAGGLWMSKFFMSRLFRKISKSPELVVSISIGWCVLVAAIAETLGLTVEMGALIAGISISTFPYHIYIKARVTPLRDFFMTLYFISLGMKIPEPQMSFLSPILLLVALVILTKFIVLVPLIKLSGNSYRTGIITSINLTQVSEFSLVIASIGLKLGHIEKENLSILLYALGITAATSTYAIKYNYKIYKLFSYFKKESIKIIKPMEENVDIDFRPIIILGFHRGAKALIDHFKEIQPDLLHKILVVDYNLEVLKELSNHGIKGIFGDISHSDTLEFAEIDRASVIISTVPDYLLKGIDNLRLVKSCRELAPDAIIYATSDIPENIPKLEKAGANKVILPYSLAGISLANEINSNIKIFQRS